MNTKAKKETGMLPLTWAAVLVLIAMGPWPVRTAVAADAGFVTIEATGSYDDTVASLRRSVARNGMMVLGEINQGEVMTRMTGMHLKAISLFVGNPNVGKKLFTHDAGVGIVLPIRINVFEQDGRTHLSYFRPSRQLASLGDATLVKMGHKLDAKLERMTGMLAR